MDTKYSTIYNEIANNIKSGVLKPNTKLYSENEYMKLYNVSRATIRKALSLLEQNGYIQKIKGKGSIVLDINKFDFPVSGIISFKEISSKIGKESNTILKKLGVIKKDDIIISELNLSNEDEIWEVIRVREIDNEKIILDKDYFNKKIIPDLTEEICKNSIYNYIENELGITISFAKKEITVQKATTEDKKSLDLDEYDMVVVVKSYTYLDDATLFQYTESRHRPDKFKFVDFARRNH